MAVAIKSKEKKTKSKKRRGQMPTKRTINLATLGEKKMRLWIAIPAVLLILVLAVVFSKFLVVDRLAEVNAAEQKVYNLQAKLDAGYEELSDFDDLSHLYAHYTYSGFTQEELSRASRVDVLKLIRESIVPWAEVSSWSVKRNELTVNMTGESLQQINLIVQQLEAQDIVDFCTVNTANTNDNTKGKTQSQEFDVVKARVTAYLNSGAGVNKE